jgi:hypothetical protein
MLVKKRTYKSYAQKPIFFRTLGRFSFVKLVSWLKFLCVHFLLRYDGIIDTPFDLFKEGDNKPFWELKRSKMEETAQYFEKLFFIYKS